jgi:diacylglycerol kinase family enzyme
LAQTFVVVNLRAGAIRRDPGLLDRVREACRGRATLHATASVEEMARAIEAIDEGVERLIVLGGDGTHMAAMSELDRVRPGKKPVIALLAGGTMCLTPRAWGASGDVVGDLTRSLRATGRVDRPTLLLTDGEGTRRVGFIWAAGFVSRFFQLYEEAGGGLSAAAGLTARLAVSALTGGLLARDVLAAVPLRLQIDGQWKSPDAYSLVVSSVHEAVGLGLRVTYRAGAEPGKIHVVASWGTPRELALSLGPALRGRPLGPHALDELARRATLEAPEGGLVHGNLDGEGLASRRFLLEEGPTLRVIRPGG